MNFQFTHPHFLLLLPPALAWVIWLAVRTHTAISPWRRWTAFVVRLVVVTAVVLAIAGAQWLRPQEGMNVFFLLDRSDSIPSKQQERSREYVNEAARQKAKTDQAGLLVFGTQAAIESSANVLIDVQKINAVVGSERTDLAGAIRLGTAAFPETGQKRLVLLSDGNENLGEVMQSVLAARPLGVTVDVVPLGVERGHDVSVQKLGLPNKVKKGQTFEAKIFINADKATTGTLRLYRNEQPLGEQKVELTAGKNLFTFPQTLTDAAFYNYTAHLDAPGDAVPQNNQATAFTLVRGDPRVLVVSADPETDKTLVAALASAKLEVLAGAFPGTLAEMQSFDSIFISNLAAGDIGEEGLKLLEAAVRDFGVGLVCIGGENTYAAGGYRGTPLEATLPVKMELDSKKVLPSGAIAMVMHGMEFMNGNQIARDCAIGVLDALGPQDEMGVVLWDGSDRWLFPMTKVQDKKVLGAKIAGMNQGDLPSFANVMRLAYEGLKKTTANLKHMIVFSDGDPGAPSGALMQSIAGDKITVSTVLIAGHAGPQTMEWIADQGNGRFYNVQNAGQLPQIFIKEAAVILKSAIFEEPFRPQVAGGSELTRGIGADEYPTLRGYVCTSRKDLTEVPLVTDKGDPLLAHWQYGLGRAVAFTSDAKPKWAKDWLGWPKYRQFWSQIAQWSLRRLENADFTTEATVDKGEGHITVEAVDDQGNYRNFLNLNTVIVSPKGERQIVRLEQTGPGRYETRFPTKEVGAYVMNVLDLDPAQSGKLQLLDTSQGVMAVVDSRTGKLRGSQVLGVAVNYSPEFSAAAPNLNLLRRIAETGGGRILDPLNPADNPFLHDRRKTFQPRDLWEWLLQIALVLFVLDVALRRIQLDADELRRAWVKVRGTLFFWQGRARPVEADESLAALLSRRDEVRAKQTAPAAAPSSPELFRPRQPAAEVQSAAPPGAAPPPPLQPPALAPLAGAKPETTTGRLLEAKRKAQRKTGN